MIDPSRRYALAPSFFGANSLRTALVVLTLTPLLAGCSSTTQSDRSAAPPSESNLLTSSSDTQTPQGGDAEETASSPTPPLPGSVGIHGIVVMRPSAEKTMFPRISLISPESGLLTAAHSFTSSEPQTLFSDWYLRLNRGSAYVSRQLFSSDYSKVVAVRRNAGGSGNLSLLTGYITYNGNYVDMSSTADGVNTFDASFDEMPAFDAADNFLFTRRPQNSASSRTTTLAKLYVARQGSTKADAIALGKPSLGYTLSPNYHVDPRDADGNTWIRLKEDGSGCANPNDIHGTACVYLLNNQVYVSGPYKESQWQGWGSPPGALGFKPLLPTSNTLTIEDPIFSSDGGHIAFKASDTTGTGKYDIYTIPSAGGDAERLPLREQLDKNDRLLEWRE